MIFDSTVIAGIIGGICTLLAAPITLYLKKKSDQRHQPKSSDQRKLALSGSWSGVLNQVTGHDSYIGNTDIKMELSFYGNKIKGSADILYIDGKDSLHGNLENGSFDGNLLRVEYVNKKRHILQNGTILLELLANGETLKGGFVGYGHVSESIVLGEINCQKD